MTAQLNGDRQGGQPVTLAAPPSWREERRLDRLATAQIARDAETARVQALIAQAEAQDRRKDARRQARQAERGTARYRRAARRAALAAWLRDHVTGLLFVPVIGVPAGLAWTGMSVYGAQLYGPAGIALPAFSEGAMWAFAGATTIRLNLTAKDGIERPVWHLRLGTAVFAGEGAVLNFLHGLSPALGHLAGPVTGTVMALVSVAGVVAHQLITAGPRRSRAERAAARDSKSAARRERAIRRAALRRAVAVLDADGGVRLVHRPGAVTLARRWSRTSVTTAPSPESPVWLPWPMVLPGRTEPEVRLGDILAAEAVDAYRDWKTAFLDAPPGLSIPVATITPAAGPPPSCRHDDDSSTASGTGPEPSPEPPPGGQQDRQQDDGSDDTSDDSGPPPETPNSRQREQSARDKAAAKIRRYPDWPDEKVADKTGVSLRTVQRARRDVQKPS